MLRPSIYPDGFVSLFDDIFREPFFSTGEVRSVQRMATDIKEYPDFYEIEMDLPGFTKSDVRAELKDGYLTIRAARSNTPDEEKGAHRYLRKERYSGHYQRTFYVGKVVSQEDIKAKFKDGVLMVQIPKKERKPKVEETKYIPIED